MTGLLSLLVREQITLTPDEILVLEATSSNSRDIYAHLGFEVSYRTSQEFLMFFFKIKYDMAQNTVSVKFGKGKADDRGIKARGEDAVGVEVWAMAKVSTNINIVTGILQFLTFLYISLLFSVAIQTN